MTTNEIFSQIDYNMHLEEWGMNNRTRDVVHPVPITVKKIQFLFPTSGKEDIINFYQNVNLLENSVCLISQRSGVDLRFAKSTNASCNLTPSNERVKSNLRPYHLP